MAPKNGGSTPGKGLFESDDCERPACDDMKAALPSSMAEFEAMKKKFNTQKKVECPPASAELGLGTWKLLHSMAAWYPDQPTKKQKNGITNFFQTLADFYPCTYCAEDFQTSLKKSPVEAESRTELCLWLCNQHNQVNQKLGKQLFECNMKDLDERWRKSSAKKCNK